MMYVLGIHEGHCATAALAKDGEVLFSLSEERLTRIKNDFTYPKKAIDRCLEMAKISASDLDHVAIASTHLGQNLAVTKKQSTFSLDDFFKEQEEFWYPKLYQHESPDYLGLFQHRVEQAKDQIYYDMTRVAPDDNASFLKERLRTTSQHLGIPQEKIKVYNHHRCHASYTYFASPFRGEDVLVFTADGFGDNANATVSLANQKEIKELSRSAQFNLGRLYSFVTLILGMKPQEHEYKVMGLAPYARPEYGEKALKVFEEVMEIQGTELVYKKEIPDHFFYFKEKLKHLRFDSISWGIQSFTEKLLTQWVRAWVKETGVSTVVFGGGVAMNVKANKRIFELPEVQKFHVPPSPADESLAMGACYLSFFKDQKFNNQPISHAYLGPEIQDQAVEEIIQQLGPQFSAQPITLDQVADLLAQGEVVARVDGAMEFGARALGNRSLMADPSSFKTVQKINRMIKKRDFWMPFTPSILAEEAHRYFKNPKDIQAKFMTITFDSTEEGQKYLEAAMHPFDQTIRPQLVDEATNPSYHALIKAFAERTGIYAILNTSFNISGLPVVNSPDQALHDLIHSGLKYLLLRNTLIIKND